MRAIILAAAILFLGCINLSYGQQADKGFDLSFVAGMNIGATTPVPIPGALNITGYNPRYNPKIGANIAYFFNEHWGIGTGLTLDWKGMKVKTKVTDVHLSIDVPNVGTLTGYVTGRNTTKVNTLYLVQPVYATYRFNAHWNIKGGIYLAETLNRQFNGNVRDVEITVESPLSQTREVPYATLDYSKDAHKFDMGLLVGGEYRLNRIIGFYSDFTWAFKPYFSRTVPIHFTMRNVYFSMGVTFRI